MHTVALIVDGVVGAGSVGIIDVQVAGGQRAHAEEIKGLIEEIMCWHLFQRCKKLQMLQIYLFYFFQLVLLFGPFWVIFGPFLAILGHFWANLYNFGSFLGNFG